MERGCWLVLTCLPTGEALLLLWHANPNPAQPSPPCSSVSFLKKKVLKK